MGETLDDGVDLGQVTGALANVGVDVLDSNGKMREVGNIMEDLMDVWGQMDTTQKNAIATTLAGKYQLARFEALMNRSDLYDSFKQSAQEGKDKGTLDVMNEKYVESLEGKLNKLQATFEGVMNSLFDSSDFYGLVDGLTQVLSLLQSFVDSLGDANNLLLGLGSIGGKVFSQQIGSGINNFILNRQSKKMESRNVAEKAALMSQFGTTNEKDLSAGQKRALDYASKTAKFYNSMSDEDKQTRNRLLSNQLAAEDKYQRTKENYEKSINATGMLYQLATGDRTLLAKKKSDDSIDVDDWVNTFYTEADSFSKKNMAPYAKQVGDVYDGLTKTSASISKIVELNGQLNQEGAKTAEIQDSIMDELGNIQVVVEKLRNQGVTIPAMLQQVDELTEDVFSNIEKGEKELSESVNKIQQVNNEATNAAKGAIEGEIFNSPEDEKLAKNQLKADENSSKTAGGELEGHVEKLTQQEKITNLVQIASGLGSVAFGLQAVKEVGDIWSEDDLTTGEKVLETITNMSMSLPMLATGVMDVKNAFTALGISAKVANASLIGLAVITAVATAWNMYEQSIQDAIDAQQDAITKQKETSDSTSQTVESWKSLYKTYQQTGEVTDEFLTSSEQIIQSLKLQGQEANVAAGNYAALADAIDKANEVELRETASEALKGNRENSALYNSISGKNLIPGVYTNNLRDKIDQIIANVADKTGMGENGYTFFTGDKTDINGQILYAKNTLNEYQAELDGLGASYDSYKEKAGEAAISQAQWTKRTSALNEGISRLNDNLNSEDVLSWISNFKTAADATAQLSEFTNKLSSATSLNDMRNIFSSTDGIAQYFSQLTDDEQLSYMAEHATSDAQKKAVNYQQSLIKLGRNAYFGTGGSDEDAADVVDYLKNTLSDEDIITFTASLDVDLTKENVENQVKNYLDNKIKVSLTGSLDTTSVANAQEGKSSFASLLDDYETAYQTNGGFTEDEAAKLIAENSDYVQYLTKVGEVYQLNEKALDAWTEKTREQTQAMQELKGETIDMSSQQDTINSLLDSDGKADWMTNILESMRELNADFSSGSIGTSGFFDGLNDAFDQLQLKIDDTKEDFANFVQDANNANFVQGVTDELYQGLVQANKQFKSGSVNVGEYSVSVSKAAKNALKLKAAQSGVNVTFEDGEAVFTKDGETIEEIGESSINSAKDLAKMAEQIKGLDAASDFNNFVTDNFEEMLKIFSDSGEVLTEAADGMGHIQTQYEETISGLAQSMTTFYTDNATACGEVAAQISTITGQSLDECKAMLTNSEALSEAMMNNTEVAGTAVQGTMNQTESAINSIAKGISSIISSIMTQINSLNGQGVEGQVTTTADAGETQDITITTDSGEQTVGTLHVPGFSMQLSTSGGGSGSGATDYSGLTNTGEVSVGNKDWGNTSGHWTRYTDAEGNSVYRQSTTDEIIEYSSQQIASGLNDLFGSTTASMGDWAPVGTGTTPSQYGNDYSDGSGSGSGGSGGSGGSDDSGSDDNYDDSVEEFLEDEHDLYEKVNTELEKTEKHLDGVAEKYDRLVGFEKIDNMDEQIADYNKLIELQKQKLEIERQEAEDQKNKLLGFGVTFDEDGIIQNYADVYNRLLQDYNALVSEYNNSTDKAYKETLKDQMDAAKESLDNFEDYIDRYDELIGDEIQSAENQIEEYYHKIEDMRIEAMKDAYDAVDDLKDLFEISNKLEGLWSGYDSDSPFRDLITDVADLQDYFNLTEDAANSMFDTIIARNRELAAQATTDEERDKYNKIADWYSSRKDNLGPNGTGIIDMRTQWLNYLLSDEGKNDFGSNTAEYYEMLNQAYEDVSQDMLDAEQKYEDAIDAVVDGYEEISDEFDKVADSYEQIVDNLDHTISMIETLDGDEAYDKIIAITQKQVDIYNDSLKQQRQALDYWEEQLQNAVSQGLDDDIISTLKEKVADAQSELNDLAESAAEAVKTIYENETDKYLEAFKNAALGTNDADFQEMQWEQAKTNAEQYLDTVERAYQVEKLRNKYQQMINDSNDPTIQKQISKAMKEQLEYLNSKVKLSEYDLNYANAQLEVLQKRIALEEAQRNKSTMKLKRDSQGNYSYVYTADQDDLLSKQQDLADAENNGYEISKENYSSQVDNYMTVINNFVENARQIREKYANDEATATAQIQALWDQVSVYLSGIQEQLSTSEQNMLNSVKQLALDSVGDVSNTYSDIASSMETNMDEALENIGVAVNESVVEQIRDLNKVDAAADSLQKNLRNSAIKYKDTATQMASSAKNSYDKVETAIDSATAAQKKLTDASKEFWNLIAEDQGTIDKGIAKINEYKDSVEDLKNSQSKTAQALRETLEELAKEKQTSAYWEDMYIRERDGLNDNSGGDSGSGDSGGDSGYTDEEAAFGIAQNIWTYGSWDNDPVRRDRIIERWGESVADRAQQIVNEYIWSGREGELLNWDSDVWGYDTGGYTGTWSDQTIDSKNGKVAFLHQKELVLNANDTENVLAAIDIVRNMTDSLKAGGLSTNINNVLNTLGTATSGLGSSVDQNVHITAEFPNATDADDIRQALLSLNERAYQVAAQPNDFSSSVRSFYYQD